VVLVIGVPTTVLPPVMRRLARTPSSPRASTADLYPRSNEVWTAGPCRSGERSRTMTPMREPLITATLFSIYVGTTGTAKALGALQRLY